MNRVTTITVNHMCCRRPCKLIQGPKLLTCHASVVR